MGIVDTVNGLLEPWLFLGLSVSYLPGTIVGLVRSREWSSFTSFDKFSFAWFGRFWTFVGPMVRESNEARVAPLLQGRVRAGMIVSAEDAVTPGVGGTVIEIGPGNGNWSGIFADSYVSTEAGLKGEDKNGERTRVNKVFGIEPNAAHHATLSRRAKEAGLEDRYQIVPVGIEDITPQLIEKESVDAIVTVLCLCSIPEPEKNIRELYTYLKPGGRWFVYEHVISHPQQGFFIRLYQRVLNIIWPSFMGGCDLCRDTESRLRNAGKWSSVDLAMPADEAWYITLPHTWGVLTK